MGIFDGYLLVSDMDGTLLNSKGKLSDENINAIKNNEVYLVDQNASSRPSQNVIKALEQMAKAVYPEHYEK